jgi:hypothetical protein
MSLIRTFYWNILTFLPMSYHCTRSIVTSDEGITIVTFRFLYLSWLNCKVIPSFTTVLACSRRGGNWLAVFEVVGRGVQTSCSNISEAPWTFISTLSNRQS